MTHIVILATIGVLITIVVAILVYHRNRLPMHLRPFFKNWAEFDARSKEAQRLMDERRAQLTNPVTVDECAEYITLNNGKTKNDTFERAFQTVLANLSHNPGEFGNLLGEIFATSPDYQNYEKAYFYYFVGLSQQGFTVGFNDQNHIPPHYGGPINDFRNEARVYGLVDELGFEKIHEIDEQAKQWLRQHNFDFQEHDTEA